MRLLPKIANKILKLKKIDSKLGNAWLSGQPSCNFGCHLIWLTTCSIRGLTQD